MLKMFDSLQTVRYEIVRAKADFYDLRETDIIHYGGEKTIAESRHRFAP